MRKPIPVTDWVVSDAGRPAQRNLADLVDFLGEKHGEVILIRIRLQEKTVSLYDEAGDLLARLSYGVIIVLEPTKGVRDLISFFMESIDEQGFEIIFNPEFLYHLDEMLYGIGFRTPEELKEF